MGFQRAGHRFLNHFFNDSIVKEPVAVKKLENARQPKIENDWALIGSLREKGQYSKYDYRTTNIHRFLVP